MWCPRINWTLLSVSSARQSAARSYLFQRLSTSRELLPESNPPWPSRRMVSGCHSIGKKKARTRGGPRRGGRPAAAEPAVVPKAIEIEGLSEHEFSAIWQNRAVAQKLSELMIRDPRLPKTRRTHSIRRKSFLPDDLPLYPRLSSHLFTRISGQWISSSFSSPFGLGLIPPHTM